MAKKPTPAAEPQDETQTLTPPEDAAMAPPEPELGAALEPVAAAPAEPSAESAPPPASVPAEPLGAFITRHEDAAMALGIVVTLISHPGAEERVHAGRYGGIHLAAGDALATYSDGTQHQ
ncbi:hypothetical protein ACTJNK_25930 [Achromobacter anxifer]